MRASRSIHSRVSTTDSYDASQLRDLIKLPFAIVDTLAATSCSSPPPKRCPVEDRIKVFLAASKNSSHTLGTLRGSQSSPIYEEINRLLPYMWYWPVRYIRTRKRQMVPHDARGYVTAQYIHVIILVGI